MYGVLASGSCKFGTENIETDNEYEILGVLINYKLPYKKHLDLKFAGSKTAINAAKMYA